MNRLFELLRNDGVHTCVALVLGGVLFMAFVYLVVADKETKFDQAALGDDTAAVTAAFGGAPIQCEDVVNASGCIRGWHERGERPVTLWLGNSQLYSLKKMKAGDKNAPAELFDLMARYEKDLITFNQPNANLAEHYIMFLYLLNRLNIKSLLLPVVFDDTRETGVRPGVVQAVEQQDVAAQLAQTKVGNQLLAEFKAGVQPKEDKALVDTPQRVVEEYLTGRLSDGFPLWEKRPEMRGELMLALYQLRNRVFGITPQTKRSIIRGRYARNMAAYAAILEACRQHMVAVLVYIPPLRNDIETPYIVTEYASFKKEVQSLAEQHGAAFANLENLVPGKFWGDAATGPNSKAELDFMHFQQGGHVLLAHKLFNQLKSLGILESNQ